MVSLKSYKRIVVYGPSGSGKTLFSHLLSKRLNLPVYSLDDFFWKEGWKMSSDIDLIKAVMPIIQSDRWILDGNYSSVRPYALPRAELAIILQPPFIVCLLRLIKRTIMRNLGIRSKNLTQLPKAISPKDAKIRYILPTIYFLGKSAWKFHKTTFKKIYNEARNFLGDRNVLVLRSTSLYKLF